MGTLTKHVTDVNSLGNYTVYGSSTTPIIEATIEGQPIGPASISITISGNGAALAAQQTIIELSGQSGDQLIRIVLRSEGTVPTIPTDRTLIDVNVASTASTTDIASVLNTVLINSGIIDSNSLDADKVIFSPDCGGAWLSSMTGSSAIVEIVDGVGFTGPETVTQTGVRLTLGSTGNGFNQSRLLFDVQKRSVTSNLGQRVFFTADTGGSTSGWNSPTDQQFFGMRGDDTTVTIADQVAATITAWNNDQNDNGGAMDASLGTLLWDLVAVIGDDTSFDVYEKDGSDLNVPTIFGGRNDLNMTIASTSRDVTIQVPVPDPHKTITPSQIRFFDPLATNLSQVAPNYIKTGAFCTWNMDNLSIDFGAGFRFNNLAANSTTMNWDQIDIIKSGDGQGSGGDAMFRTNVFQTLNWKNCTVKWYPMAVDSNLSAFMLDAGPGNIILQWERVFLRYSGNSQMHIQFEIDKENSFLIDCGIIGDGVSTGGVFNNPVTTFPLARFLTPFSFINQNRPILVSAAPSDFSASDSYTDSSLFVGFNNGGSGVTTSTEFLPFANQTSYFKYVNFTSANQIYINGAGFTNAVSSAAGNPDGSIEYAISFDPSYFDSSGNDLTNVRNEFRYGLASDNDELRVKETFESGPIGGASATLTTFETNTANLVVGDIFTIPRPNGLTDIKVTAVSGTPVQNGDSLEFNIGTDIDATVANITTAFRNSTDTAIGVWCIIPSRPDLIPVGTAKNFVFGNNIGGTAALATYSGTASNLTITSLQTGAPGSGTFTHPFNAGIFYIDATEGLLNTNTSTDNQYRANTSPSLGVGNNNGLFLTYNKTNYLNNSARASNTQVSSNLYKSQFTTYTTRFAYRPEISTFNFSDGPQTLSKILVADIHWEDVSKAVVDAYTRTSMVNTNDVYRWIENETNDGTLSGNNFASVYDRPINFNSPVDSGALIDLGSLNLAFNTNITNPSYNSADNFFSIPVQSSLNTGGTTLGFKTSGRIDLDSSIDFNQVILETSGNLELVGSNITNGIVRASTVTSTGNITGTQFEVPPGETSYTITHSGGTFQDVTMDAGGILQTDDASLHGLTADNITIDYQDATADFSVDSPGAITNSSFRFSSLTQGITWNIAEDLSTCTAVNDTNFDIFVVLDPGGQAPAFSTAPGKTGGFSLARTINLNLPSTGTISYLIRNSSTKAEIASNTGTHSGIVTFNAIGAIEVYASRTDSLFFEPFVMTNVSGNVDSFFTAQNNVNSSVANDSTLIALYTSYLADIDLTLDTNNIRVELPFQFMSGGNQQTTSVTYWDDKGDRAAGGIIFKFLERRLNYARTVLNNQSTKVTNQLIQLAGSNKLVILSGVLRLFSKMGVTGNNAAFPGEFVDDSQVSGFSIVGTGDPDTGPAGLVFVYGTTISVDPGPLTVRIFADRVGEVMDDRRVTRENMNNLGILAPINDADPT